VLSSGPGTGGNGQGCLTRGHPVAAELLLVEEMLNITNEEINIKLLIGE